MWRRRQLLSSPLRLLSSSSSRSYTSSCKQTFLSPPPLKPPSAKRVPFACSAHGRTWGDPFHWMSNTADPELVDYLEHENAYAEAFMADTAGLQRTLAEEMKSRIPAVVSTPPEPWGPWLYYQHIPEGKEYPVLCRKLKKTDSFLKNIFSYTRGFTKEQILLDWNEIAEKFGYVHVGACRISPDHKFLAYTLDTSGDESFILHIKDLQSGCIIPHSKVEGVVSLAWTCNSSVLLYTVCDETQRPYRVITMDVSSGLADRLLFTENDLSYCVDITSTKDGRFITINSNSRISSEEGHFLCFYDIKVYVLDTVNTKEELWLVRKRESGVQYFLEHYNGFFYILTNAPLESKDLAEGEYYLARCTARKSRLAKWEIFLLPDQDITFQDMDMFHEHMVLSVQRKGLPTFCSIKIPTSVKHELPFKLDDLSPWFFPLPSSFCSVVPGSNHDYMSSLYRVIVSSPEIPDVIVDYNLDNQTWTVVHQEEVIGVNEVEEKPLCKSEISDGTIDRFNMEHAFGGYLRRWTNLSDSLFCETREVISHDGFMVPLTIVYSRKAHSPGMSPALLHGYGAYGEILDKSWSSDQLSLLSRGWVLAYADVRGGGKGSLHSSGAGANKTNSIYDFAACGKYLGDESFVHKDKLAAIGYSAGGLLVAAAINKFPKLFSSAILKVPFLDIRNTLLDPSLPLTILDYEEFGDPRSQADFEIISQYSPYDNIIELACYPSVLVTASFLDSRVGVWEAAKWVARVRERTCTSCSLFVILKTNMNGGHFGEGGRYIQCDEKAFEYAFLIKAMGMLEDTSKACLSP